MGAGLVSPRDRCVGKLSCYAPWASSKDTELTPEQELGFLSHAPRMPRWNHGRAAGLRRGLHAKDGRRMSSNH